MRAGIILALVEPDGDGGRGYADSQSEKGSALLAPCASLWADDFLSRQAGWLAGDVHAETLRRHKAK